MKLERESLGYKEMEIEEEEEGSGWNEEMGFAWV